MNDGDQLAILEQSQKSPKKSVLLSNDDDPEEVAAQLIFLKSIIDSNIGVHEMIKWRLKK